MDKKKLLIIKLLEKIKAENTDSYNYIIPNFISKKLVDYHSIRNDLLHVIRATQILIERKYNEDPIVNACIWHSIIITYGKCFTDASISKRTKLEINSVILTNEIELKMIHDKLIHLRHNFIAHRGDNEYEISIAFLKIPKKNNNDFKSSNYKIKSLTRFNPSVVELESYLLLFDRIKKHVEKKLQKQGDKTHNGFVSLIKSIPLLPKYTLIK